MYFAIIKSQQEQHKTELAFHSVSTKCETAQVVGLYADVYRNSTPRPHINTNLLWMAARPLFLNIWQNDCCALYLMCSQRVNESYVSKNPSLPLLTESDRLKRTLNDLFDPVFAPAIPERLCKH